jgi:hypothetical protein
MIAAHAVDVYRLAVETGEDFADARGFDGLMALEIGV